MECRSPERISRRQRLVYADALTDYPFTSHSRGTFVQTCEVAGFTPHIAYTSDDIIVDQALVAAGLGVTTMPGLALSSYRAAGVRASEVTSFRRLVYVATYGEPPDPPATTNFVTAMRSTSTQWSADGDAPNGSGLLLALLLRPLQILVRQHALVAPRSPCQHQS